MEYTKRGRLTLAEVGGQIFVATEPNLDYLKGYVERGEEAELNPGKDNTTGRPWMWVNAPKGGAQRATKIEQVNEPGHTAEYAVTLSSPSFSIEDAIKAVDAKLDRVLAGIKMIEDMAK